MSGSADGRGLSPLPLSSVIALSPAEMADEFEMWADNRLPDARLSADDRLDDCGCLVCEGGDRDGTKAEEEVEDGGDLRRREGFR